MSPPAARNWPWQRRAIATACGLSDLPACRPEGAPAPRAAGKEAGGFRRRPRAPEQRITLAAQQVDETLRLIEREAIRVERTIPTVEEREIVATTFWHAIREFEAVNRQVRGSERLRCAATARELLHPWLLRSDYWSRSCLKPHGYACDFRTLEWIYDLERNACTDPTKPIVVNLLDYLYRTLHSVRAVWHRRRWYAQLVAEVLASSPARQPVRILDLGCGGSRYLRDVIGPETDNHSVEITFLDPDPPALAFIRDWLPRHLRKRTRLICGSAQHTRELILDTASGALAHFDLVISTSVLNYLEAAAARKLLVDMTSLARPGGLLAVSNFSPEDNSRLVKDWILEWPLIYRHVSTLRGLVTERHAIGFDRSPDGAYFTCSCRFRPMAQHPPELGP